MNLKIKKLHPDAVIPSYAREGDAGLDLYALNDFSVFCNKVTHIKTGIAIELPVGYVGLVCSRSGLAAKKGVWIPNAPGVIDSGYRGDVGVLLTYNGQAEEGKPNPIQIFNGKSKVVNGVPVLEMELGVQFKKGDKIAQLIIQKVETVQFEEVTELGDSQRGDGGFGSTGQ